MRDEIRSPVQHQLVLRRHSPGEVAPRFYMLMIELDLFGNVRLVRNWGVVGTNGREKVEEYRSMHEAGTALEAAAREQRKRGYKDL